jgi:hypothetical protein
MNVTDVIGEKTAGDRLEMIFDRQKELMEKYAEIEKKSGVGKALLPEVFHIDDPRVQAVCKDFAWRVTEELAECADALHQGDGYVHAHEEAVDSLHFLVELFLLNGIGPGDVRSCPFEEMFDSHAEGEYVGLAVYGVVLDLGRAMNCLKNKPWKQTHMETDAVRYRGHLVDSFHSWVRFAATIGMNAESVFDMYFKKSEVNKFRIRSEY